MGDRILKQRVLGGFLGTPQTYRLCQDMELCLGLREAPSRFCFFSRSFAFNRLVRMKYYEKILSKDTEICLFTTCNKNEKNEFLNSNLKQTKVICKTCSNLKLPFVLRKFSNKNKIDRLVNIGNFRGAIPILLATLFSKRDYIVNIFGQIPTFLNSLKKLSLKEFSLSFLLFNLKKL